MSLFLNTCRLLCISVLFGTKSLVYISFAFKSKVTDKVNLGLTGAHHNFCKPAYNKGWEQTPINSHYQFLCQAAMSEVKSQTNVICLKNLAANIEKNTDVIVAGRRSDATEHVIFFGGDVQDYPENMMNHRDNGRYVQWNSIATAELLAKRFPTAMVMVFKPQSMHLNTFSVYSQFVESNDFGCPKHSRDFGAWRTLSVIYHEVIKNGLISLKDLCTTEKAESLQSSENSSVEDSDNLHEVREYELACVDKVVGDGTTSFNSSVADIPIHLIGFSKGCVVLNQLLFEIEAACKDGSTLLPRVHAMTWLDGGHSGGSNTWLTDRSVLKCFASLPITVSVHVTPYQVKDEMRAWIGKEKRRFVEQLTKEGMKITDKIHFEDDPKSIENHFRVLEVF